jgi:hypothetical protein
MKLVTIATPIFAHNLAEAGWLNAQQSVTSVSQPASHPEKSVYKYDLTAIPYF